MDLDKLKCCAEALGAKVSIGIHTGDLYVVFPDGLEYGGLTNPPYDPEHNDAQAFELLKWLIKNTTDHRALWLMLINLTRNGELSNQAVIEAVWEVKK